MMLSKLFRKEALDSQSHKLMGKVIIIQPVKNYLITLCLFLIIVFGVIYLANTSFSRKVTVEGFLTPDTGLVKIYGKKGGRLREINIQAGQIVKENDIIAYISLEDILEGGGNVKDIYLKELNVQEHEMTKSLENLVKNQDLLLQNSQSKVLSYKKELKQLEQQYKIQEIRYNNAFSQVKILQKLYEKKYASNTELLRYKEQALSIKQVKHQMQQQKIKILDYIKQEEKQLDLLPLNFKKEYSSLILQQSRIIERRTAIKNNSGYTLRSPIDGKISSVQIKKGQTIIPSVPLVTIISNNSNLQAELMIPSRAIGFIEIGQMVKLQYDAFPYQQYGIYQGKIKFIHNNLFNPNELLVPFQLKEPVYRIIIEIDQQKIRAYGKKFPLQPGMLLKGDVILKKRTILEWMLEPLMSYKKEAPAPSAAIK